MEIVKVIASFLTPLSVLFIGYLLLKKSEGIKREVGLKYDFINKWASDFYNACASYMQQVEQYLALLHFLNRLEDKDSETGCQVQSKITDIHMVLPEYQLRIKRMAIFAPLHGTEVKNATELIADHLTKMIKTGGSFDNAIALLNGFNKCARKCHLEMLSIAQNTALKENQMAKDPDRRR